MLETHDEQLRNMKERWNLLQTLRKEKRAQRISGISKSPEGEPIIVATEHGHGIKRKKKAKSAVFRGYIPQQFKNVTVPPEPIPSASTDEVSTVAESKEVGTDEKLSVTVQDAVTSRGDEN